MKVPVRSQHVIARTRYIVMQLCYSQHWTLAVVDKEMKGFHYFDSFAKKRGNRLFSERSAYRWKKKMEIIFKRRQWTTKDGLSCGIYVIRNYFSFFFRDEYDYEVDSDFITLLRSYLKHVITSKWKLMKEMCIKCEKPCSVMK